MRRVTHSLIPILLLVLFAFVSCGPDYRFQATYPEGYTAEYFYGNYVQADPNLIHLYAAENEAGKYDENGTYLRYYAIKDIPIDEYVCYEENHVILDPTFSSYIARNKAIALSEPEILSYAVSSAELYWHDGWYFYDKYDMEAVGENICHETVASIDAAAFQKSLKDCIETESYAKNIYSETDVIKSFVNNEGITADMCLKIRVHFSDYENIVWDGTVVTLNGVEDEYYVVYQSFAVTESVPEGYYIGRAVPLDEDIARLIDAIK